MMRATTRGGRRGFGRAFEHTHASSYAGAPAPQAGNYFQYPTRFGKIKERQKLSLIMPQPESSAKLEKAGPGRERPPEEGEILEKPDVSEFLELLDEGGVRPQAPDNVVNIADLRASGYLPRKTAGDKDASDRIAEKIGRIRETISEISPEELQVVGKGEEVSRLEKTAHNARQRAGLELDPQKGGILRQYMSALDKKRIDRTEAGPMALRKGDLVHVGDTSIQIRDFLGRGGMGSVFEAVDSEGDERAFKLSEPYALTPGNLDNIDLLFRENLAGRILTRGEIVDPEEIKFIQNDIRNSILDRNPEMSPSKLRWKLEEAMGELDRAEGRQAVQEVMAQYKDIIPPFRLKEYYRAQKGRTRKVKAVPEVYQEQAYISEDANGTRIIQVGTLMENMARENRGRKDPDRIRDLKSLMDKYPERLSFKDRLTMSMSSLFALRKIHERGIAHRDIKPGNTMVDPLDLTDVKLFDLGLASPEYRKLTEAGTVSGTPNFMSPEAASGRSEDLRPQDVWAMGRQLYETFYDQKGMYEPQNSMDMLFHTVREGTFFRENNYLKEEIARSIGTFRGDLLSLVKKMTEKNPKQRITAEDAAKEFYKIYREYKGKKGELEIHADEPAGERRFTKEAPA